MELSRKCRSIYLTAVKTDNPRRLRTVMIMPARRTPRTTATTLFLKSRLRKLAASVPVHAPVPGSGIPTKRRSARNIPFPAFSVRALPPFSPFSRHHVKNLPITGLSLPHSRTFLAKKNINGTGIMLPIMHKGSTLYQSRPAATPKGTPPLSSTIEQSEQSNNSS